MLEVIVTFTHSLYTPFLLLVVGQHLFMNDKMRVKMWSSMATRGSLGDRYGGAEHILLVSDSNASIEEQTVVASFSAIDLQ